VRIVGGAARGRRLVAAGPATRPTSERAREALFNTLATLVDLDGARVLDLFAGSGAVGLEALSRGAAVAVLVDDDRRAVDALRRNAATVALPGALVRRRSAAGYLADAAAANRSADDGAERVSDDAPHDPAHDPARDPARDPADGPFDVVFADPPYALDDTALAGVLVAVCPLLADGAVVVVERAARGTRPPWPDCVTPLRERRYGEGVLWYGRRP
jgi:16S rRNA (guanine966-N2)-methyltransferase